jgi:ribosomal protein L30
MTLAALLAGVSAGIGLIWWIRRSHVRRARSERELLMREAQRDLEHSEVEEQQLREQTEAELEREATEELDTQQNEINDYSAGIEEREKVLRLRETDVGELTKEVQTREAAVQEQNEELKRLRKEREAVVNQSQGKLEEVSGMAAEDAIGRLIEERVEKAEHQGQVYIRSHEELVKEDAANDAARIMGTVVDRYAGVSHLERVQNAIPIPDERTLSAFAAPDSPSHAAFTEAIGCELYCDETAGTATVRGDDPLGREVARRVLRQIANRSIHAPDRVRGVAKQVKSEIGYNRRQRATLRGLGIRRMGRVVEVEDTPSVRGMIDKVSHLIVVVED